MDVTRRYTADFAAVQSRRTDVPEAWLVAMLAQLTERQRSALALQQQQAAAARDAQEAADLAVAGMRGRAVSEPMPGAGLHFLVDAVHSSENSCIGCKLSAFWKQNQS